MLQLFTLFFCTGLPLVSGEESYNGLERGIANEIHQSRSYSSQCRKPNKNCIFHDHITVCLTGKQKPIPLSSCCAEILMECDGQGYFDDSDDTNVCALDTTPTKKTKFNGKCFEAACKKKLKCECQGNIVCNCEDCCCCCHDDSCHCRKAACKQAKWKFMKCKCPNNHECECTPTPPCDLERCCRNFAPSHYESRRSKIPDIHALIRTNRLNIINLANCLNDTRQPVQRRLRDGSDKYTKLCDQVDTHDAQPSSAPETMGRKPVKTERKRLRPSSQRVQSHRIRLLSNIQKILEPHKNVAGEHVEEMVNEKNLVRGRKYVNQPGVYPSSKYDRIHSTNYLQPSTEKFLDWIQSNVQAEQ